MESILEVKLCVHRLLFVRACRTGVATLGCEDALIHLLNYVWPNIFETSPHVINAVMDAIQGLTVALGPTRIFMYVAQGLFHPARRYVSVYTVTHIPSDLPSITYDSVLAMNAVQIVVCIAGECFWQTCSAGI